MTRRVIGVLVLWLLAGCAAAPTYVCVPTVHRPTQTNMLICEPLDRMTGE